MEKKTFTLSDESINSYGFRVLTSGIDIARFKKNPVMLLLHNDWSLAIGRWEKIRKVGTQLLADAVFFMDSQDPKVQDAIKQVEQGFLKTASIGFDILGISEDSKDMVKGQLRPTVTKSVLMEASLVPIPSNGNALMLMNQGQTFRLSGIPQSDSKVCDEAGLTILSKKEKENPMDVKKFLSDIGNELSTIGTKILSAVPTETEVVVEEKPTVSDTPAEEDAAAPTAAVEEKPADVVAEVLEEEIKPETDDVNAELKANFVSLSKRVETAEANIEKAIKENEKLSASNAQLSSDLLKEKEDNVKLKKANLELSGKEEDIVTPSGTSVELDKEETEDDIINEAIADSQLYYQKQIKEN